jgi:hypothetical protein
MAPMSSEGASPRLAMAMMQAGFSALAPACHQTPTRQKESASGASTPSRQDTPTRIMEEALQAMSLGEQHPPSTIASLMTLPAELRLEIFDYLIRPGDVYIHWSARVAHHDVRFAHILEDWDKDTNSHHWAPSLTERATLPPCSPTHPEAQLFLVCKQLYDEAMHYYLTKNTFHIMGADYHLPYLS